MADHIELDEFALPEAVLSYRVERVHRQPDVGIFKGYHEVTAWVVSWSVGALKLPRRDLVTAMGETAVEAFEERAAEAHARELDTGNGSQCDARFDTLQEAMA